MSNPPRSSPTSHRSAGAPTRSGVAARAALVTLAAVQLLAGCGGDQAPRSDQPAPRASAPDEGRGKPPAGRPAEDGGAIAPDGHRSHRVDRGRGPRVTCPPQITGCRTAGGRILYIEAVDPDGDGDAHFVLASRQSITAPGISVIDVARELRPRPLPRPGSRLRAAGPVYRGSFGQRQIEAVAVRVAKR